MGNTASSSSSKDSDITTIKSESHANDDVLTLSNDTEDTKKAPQRPIEQFTIRRGDPQWNSFVFLVTKYIYSRNAFPNEQQMKEMCMEIANVLNSGTKPASTSYHISRGLIRRVYSIGDLNRRHVHGAVERWIQSFEWPVSAFPLICSTSKAELYKYLMHHARFARKDYDQNGRMLQNHCLTHCLNYVMFKDKRTLESFKYQQLDNPIPRPLVVFVMVMIHYNLEKLACKYERLQAKSHRRSKFSRYYPTNTWHRSEYRALLDRSSKQGRQLQWDRIMQIVSQKLDTLDDAEADDGLDDLLGPTMSRFLSTQRLQL